MCASVARTIEAERGLLVRLAKDVIRHFGARLAVMRHAEIESYLRNHPTLCATFDGDGSPTAAEYEFAYEPAEKFSAPTRKSFLAPAASKLPHRWPIPAYNLPQIDSVNELCTLLDIHPQRLDAWTRRFRQSPQHCAAFDAYFSYWQPKRSGGARLIEHPKSDLKQAQRRLLTRLLNKVDPHEAAHGFRRGHSILTHARAHTGQQLVLRCDLKDFFASVRASRIHAVFRHLGYHESVARALTMLTTTRAPRDVAHAGKAHGVDPDAIKRYQSDHLPQGAASSPALANLAAFKLDLRLSAIAEQFGAAYTRYADDLTFSGGAKSGIAGERFYLRVAAIAIEEGFALNMRKTRLMHESARQETTGLVVNAHPNIAREEFDLLKAILTNAARHGLAAQNRARHANFRSHLIGRIAFVRQINETRGRRLFELLANIE